MAVVQSYAKFAIDETDGAVREDSEEICRAAQHAPSLTRQLLVFARREVVAPEVLDVNDVVAEIEKLLGRTAGDEYVSLTVADTGAGMSSEVRERAFEPFFTTRDASHGTALGRRPFTAFVDQAGGTIRLDSAVGAGTTVTVHLPLTVERARSAGRRPTDRQRAAVLVVEDEAPVGALTCRVLEAHGYCVLSARRGEQALELCREHREAIGLLLTDSVMPAMAGTELAASTLGLVPSLRILYMSGYVDDEHIRPSAIPPGPELLQKPFGRDGLLRHVARALDRTSPGTRRDVRAGRRPRCADRR